MTTKPTEPESLSGPVETLPSESVLPAACALLVLHQVAVRGVGEAAPIAAALRWTPAGVARILRFLAKEGFLVKFGTVVGGDPTYHLAYDVATRLTRAGSTR